MGKCACSLNKTGCACRLRGLQPAPERGLLVKDAFGWQLRQSLVLLNYFGAWTKVELGKDMDRSSKKVVKCMKQNN